MSAAQHAECALRLIANRSSAERSKDTPEPDLPDSGAGDARTARFPKARRCRTALPALGWLRRWQSSSNPSGKAPLQRAMRQITIVSPPRTGSCRRVSVLSRYLPLVASQVTSRTNVSPIRWGLTFQYRHVARSKGACISMRPLWSSDLPTHTALVGTILGRAVGAWRCAGVW